MSDTDTTESATPIEVTDAAPSTADAVAARMAAAMAALGPDEESQTEPEALAPKIEAKKAEPPKPVEPEKTEAEKKAEALVSPQLAAVQRAKKRAEDEIAIKRDQFAKERAEYDSEKPAFDAYKLAKATKSASAIAKAHALSDDERVKVAQEWLYAAMGSDAPAEWQAKKEMWAIKQEAEEAKRLVQDFKRQQEEDGISRQRAQAQEAEEIGARSFLREYVKTIDDKRPHLQVQAEADPAQLAEDMLRIALDYRRYRANELKIPVHDLPETEGLSAEEIATRLEQRLEKSLSPYRAKWQPKTEIKPAAETQPAPKTLSNRSSSPTAPRPAAQTEKERIARAMAALERGG